MKALTFLLVLLATAACGCGNMFKGKQAGEQSVLGFHQLYNDGKYAEMYAASDAKFKSASAEKGFLDLMAAVQRKLGKVTESVNGGFRVQTFNFTTTVVLNQNTKFERGAGTEVFTFEMAGGKAVLVGYNINSQDLILK
jgi:hypothetical protein